MNYASGAAGILFETGKRLVYQQFFLSSFIYLTAFRIVLEYYCVSMLRHATKLASTQGDNIHLEKQLENHRAIYLKIARQRGGLKNAKEYLNQCLYYVNIGSNDYINNFFLPEQYPSSRIYNLERYTNLLISKLSQYLEVFYNFLFAFQ